jgi:hypothetical protein
VGCPKTILTLLNALYPRLSYFWLFPAPIEQPSQHFPVFQQILQAPILLLQSTFPEAFRPITAFSAFAHQLFHFPKAANAAIIATKQQQIRLFNLQIFMFEFIIYFLLNAILDYFSFPFTF